MTTASTNNQTSFNEEFRIRLEHHLCSTFENFKQPKFKGFWCDGVSFEVPDGIEAFKKQINDKREYKTIAWIGKDGQDEYEMTIKFGKYSLRRIAEDSDLMDCLPNDNSLEWLDLDTGKKTIEIRLK